MLQTGQQVNVAPPQSKAPVQKSAPSRAARVEGTLQAVLAVPLASWSRWAFTCAFRTTNCRPKRIYIPFLGAVLAVALVAAGIQFFWPGLRRWMRNMCPIFAAAILIMALWELITGVLRWLPLPYFPAPAAVLQSLMSDRAFCSTAPGIRCCCCFRVTCWACGCVDHRRVHRLVQPACGTGACRC